MKISSQERRSSARPGTPSRTNFPGLRRLRHPKLAGAVGLLAAAGAVLGTTEQLSPAPASSAVAPQAPTTHDDVQAAPLRTSALTRHLTPVKTKHVAARTASVRKTVTTPKVTVAPHSPSTVTAKVHTFHRAPVTTTTSTTTTTVPKRTKRRTPATTTTTVAKTTTTTVAPTTTTVAAPATTAASSATDTVSGLAMPVGNLPGWRQTVADDFTGGSLPADFYQSAYEGHPSNDPSQGTWLPSHVVVTNGMLELRDYQDPASNDPQADNWTGGGVMMSETQTYGMYEVRMKCTPGAGVSCIALLWGTNTWPPEIDFYEDAPTDNTREGMSATAHFSSANQQIQKDLSGIDMTQWHTYGVVWTPSTISYTVDGTTWASFANPDDNANDRYGFAGPMNLGLQIQVGDGAFPTSQTPSEVDLDVDWIVAYAQN